MIKKIKIVRRTYFALFIFIFLTPVLINADNKEYLSEEAIKESAPWFRKYGDYIVYLTLQEASPRDYMLFTSSNMSFFETGIGKRLRLGSPTKDFHWGIEFALFTSLTRYGVWNFKNISCDAKYGIFGLLDMKPAIFLFKLAHYCSNLLQGAPDFSPRIRYSQYFIYGEFFYPAATPKFFPLIKSIKPYAGVGVYLYQFPKSYHIPFDLGIEVESQEFLFSMKTVHLDFHCFFSGMQRLISTCTLFLGWGTSRDSKIESLPFSVGVLYQWGQDARGQFYQQRRKLLGIRINLIY